MTRFRREIRNGKLYIDLRKIGTFSTEDDVYLAGLIAIACSESHAKHYLSFAARHDFGWNDKLLSTYILAGLMNQYSTRANGFISSGEWLCGVFASGPILSKEHLRILMSYVNPLVSNGMILNGVYSCPFLAEWLACCPLDQKAAGSSPAGDVWILHAMMNKAFD